MGMGIRTEGREGQGSDRVRFGLGMKEIKRMGMRMRKRMGNRHYAHVDVNVNDWKDCPPLPSPLFQDEDYFDDVAQSFQ